MCLTESTNRSGQRSAASAAVSMPLPRRQGSTKAAAAVCTSREAARICESSRGRRVHAAATASSTGANTGGAGQYQGSLVSSLQTLIQQLGTNGTASASTANLSASFNSLVQGTSGASASGSTASNASLQSF